MAFSPTISAAWVLSEEKWLKDVSWVNFLKLRASFGVINVDYLPKDGSTTVYDYWDQIYTTTGTQYKFNSSYALNSEVLLSGAWQLLIRHMRKRIIQCWC